MDEIWANIIDYPNYMVSTNGNVKSVKKGFPMTLVPNKDGYLLVGILNEDGRKFKAVSRLVATCFCENPDNLPEVNHKDLNKQNNNYTNLEWTDRIGNVQHYHNKIKSQLPVNKKATLRKKVYAYNIETKEMLQFDSRTDCTAYFNVEKTSVGYAIKHKCKFRTKYKLFNEDDWEQFNSQSKQIEELKAENERLNKELNYFHDKGEINP